MDDTGIKREPVIRISNDRMEAFIMLPTVEEEYHYTVDEVLEAVNRNGVIYGINCETISDMVEKSTRLRWSKKARRLQTIVSLLQVRMVLMCLAG